MHLIQQFSPYIIVGLLSILYGLVCAYLFAQAVSLLKTKVDDLTMNITPKNKVPTSFLITYLYRRHIEFIRNASYLCGVGSMGAAGISCAEQMPYTMGFIIFAILCFIIYSYSAKENPMPDWVTLMERINTFNDNLSNKESLLKDLLDASKTEAIQNYTAEASYDTWKVEMLMRGKDSLVMNVDATDNTYIPLFSLLMKKESKYYLIKYFYLKYINGDDGIQFVISDQNDTWTKSFLQEDRKLYKEIYGEEAE